ncbi:HAD-IIIC family phosphatase [Mucilaginibacter sp. UYCu711]|uniref:HAD-IIIC family phosphatase n=1 Tax=Mucilaginibacter sp. UYCu711 TaxID=3156339 RepID=UPI003D1C4ED1
MKNFAQLKRNLKQDISSFLTLKVALLGDSATQLLNQAIRGTGVDHNFNLQIWEADFGQIEQQITDRTSELYEFAPAIVIIFHSSHKLLAKYNKMPVDQQSALAEGRLQLIGELYNIIKERLGAKLIYYNYQELDDGVFGNYANSIPSSFLFQLRKLNYELMQFAASHPSFYISDLSFVQNQIGKMGMFHSPLYINTDMVLSIEALPLIASRTLELIGSLQGKIRKCVVLDLDNTLWGGTIGDDGIENIQLGYLGIGKAFTEFQHWLKKLKNRGIILAVCSKNTESVALGPFKEHADMVLKPEDIAVFIANWENKVDNICTIQNILNISFESMVFLDDNPFERNMVREAIPDIIVPELPEDPADYLEYLYTLNLFETTTFSDADSERTGYYKAEVERAILQNNYKDEKSFLKNLEMVAQVEPFNKFNIPRVTQLSQRSNQFNLRTIRYTEADIERLSSQTDIFPFTFTLIDKYGNNGLICVIILQEEDKHILFINTWFMSCRVLKRGMENFTLNTIANFAKQSGYTTLKGEYFPTTKNEMVKSHYEKLGFKKQDNYWILDIKEYRNKECFITQKTIDE